MVLLLDLIHIPFTVTFNSDDVIMMKRMFSVKILFINLFGKNVRLRNFIIFYVQWELREIISLSFLDLKKIIFSKY